LVSRKGAKSGQKVQFSSNSAWRLCAFAWGKSWNRRTVWERANWDHFVLLARVLNTVSTSQGEAPAEPDTLCGEKTPGSADLGL